MPPWFDKRREAALEHVAKRHGLEDEGLAPSRPLPSSALDSLFRTMRE